MSTHICPKCGHEFEEENKVSFYCPQCNNWWEVTLDRKYKPPESCPLCETDLRCKNFRECEKSPISTHSWARIVSLPASKKYTSDLGKTFQCVYCQSIIFEPFDILED